MTNREFMQSLSDDDFEATMYHVEDGNFDIADSIADPTRAVLTWLAAEYDPNDRLWQTISDEAASVSDDYWEE